MFIVTWITGLFNNLFGGLEEKQVPIEELIPKKPSPQKRQKGGNPNTHEGATGYS